MIKIKPLKITEIAVTCDDSPYQLEALTESGRPVYIRCRRGSLSVGVGKKGHPIGSAINGPNIEYYGLKYHWDGGDSGYSNICDYKLLKKILKDCLLLPKKPIDYRDSELHKRQQIEDAARMR